MRINKKLTDLIMNDMLAKMDNWKDYADMKDQDIIDLIQSNWIYAIENEVDWDSVVTMIKNEAEDQEAREEARDTISDLRSIKRGFEK